MCWRICCRIIYLCDPFTCETINVNDNGGGEFTLSVPNNYGEVTWYVDDVSFTGNSYTGDFPQNTSTTVCAYYYDSSSGCYYLCYTDISPNCDLPEASFTYNITNETVIFNDNSTNSSGQGSLTYQWSFGENNTTSSLVTVSYTHLTLPTICSV